MKKKVAIIGAGPGGLTAGMLLSHRGFEVEIFEKNATVGGRNGALRKDGYTFDIGPTFLLQRFTLDQMFEEVGKKAEDYLDFAWLDPMYRLQFANHVIDTTTDLEKMKEQIAQHYPGNEKGVDRFFEEQQKKFKHIFRVLQRPYSSLKDLMHPSVFRAIPYIASKASVMDNLGRYFDNDELKLAFTFQSKYLGMSPWDCPQVFTILPYIEYQYGLYHVMGGLNQISEAMADIVREQGGKIHLSTPVKQILRDGKTITGILLESGERIEADEYIINADFAHAMDQLVEKSDGLKTYKPRKLEKMQYSCSTFMLYLGLDRLYEEQPHHTILFAKDYKRNVAEIIENVAPSEDMSIYIHNASVTDSSLAPEGHSALYVLVPTINHLSSYDWEKEAPRYRDLVLDTLEKRTSLKNLRQHITSETMITPQGWQNDYAVYGGAVFNLAHIIDQMLYWRPRNRFQDLDHCWLVGGGTHPGSGLPTIYESGRISSNLICDRYGVSYDPPPLPF